MNIHLIAAIDLNRGLGAQGRLLYHLPRDLAYFKANTLHQTVLMGRKTFESIGKALPQRHNIVLTRGEKFFAPGCTLADSLETALSLVPKNTTLWVIGGAEIYTQCLPIATKVFLTQIHHSFDEADTFFPELHPERWQKVSSEFYDVSDKNRYPITFEVYAISRCS
ncbi:MAG: dihydrofolate reductase [Gammaproteobacteria bacterium]|nr:dihydrofolate reductase [Gammaproteobacteria bacterium]MCD8542358.1 dihydrofolate reductase [Gammaproteobacteria bacterium]